jgi:hypothetical protein
VSGDDDGLDRIAENDREQNEPQDAGQYSHERAPGLLEMRFFHVFIATYESEDTNDGKPVRSLTCIKDRKAPLGVDPIDRGLRRWRFETTRTR